MENKNSWHLSKTFNVGLILALAGMLIGGATTLANMQRDILECQQDFHKIAPKVTAIYDGLLVRGIIDPM